MMTLTTFLKHHADEHAASFHMPGHKGAAFFRRFGYGDFLARLADADITEIHGADNLFRAEGVLKAGQDGFARLFGVPRSYWLVGGSSVGILAAILTAVPPGGKLLMARNAHKSVFNALALGGIEPVWLRPSLLPDFGVAGGITPEAVRAALARCDAAAVILPSPNYYGVCSDIRGIARETRAAGRTLIVDQAHGAHLTFFGRFGREGGLPEAAEAAGADLVINSTHKTLCSFTQSAILNVNTDRIDRERLEDRLQALQSSSPSYILMASLDMCRAILEKHGAALIGEWQENLDRFYDETAGIPGLTVMNDETTAGAGRLDRTKLNLDASRLGADGRTLEIRLREAGVYAELSTGRLAMCMTGVGNTRRDYERLTAALRDLSARGRGRAGDESILNQSGTLCDLPTAFDAACAEAVFVGVPARARRVPLREAAGLVCARAVIPYPPGIPLICPGERVTREAAALTETLRAAGETVLGLTESGEMFAGEA